jgi:hypothetical protein
VLVKINTDNRIDGHQGLARRLEAMVEEKLLRFGDRLTRAEVHVRDLNGPAGGPGDVRALVELRPAGRDPLSASHTASEVEAAVLGAVTKAATALDRVIGKTTTRKGH